MIKRISSRIVSLAKSKQGLDNLCALRPSGMNYYTQYSFKSNFSLTQTPAYNFSEVKIETQAQNSNQKKTDVKVGAFMTELTVRVRKALTEKKTFSTQPVVNKMILEFIKKNPEPNFFDSLMILNLINRNTVSDSLTKTIQNDIFQAHKVLKAYLEGDEEISKVIFEDRNYFKLLLVLSDHTFKDFAMNNKQYSTLFSQLYNKDQTDREILNAYAKKLIFVNKNSYTQRTKHIALDILRFFVCVHVDTEYYKEVPEKLKANDYKLYDEFENNLYSTCNIINHVLHNSKESPEKFINTVNNYLDTLTNYFYMCPPSLKLCPLLIEISWMISNVGNNNHLRFAEMILRCNEIICSNMDKFTIERFTRIVFILSRINIVNLNYQAYDLLSGSLIDYFNRNMDKMNDEQLKSNFYAIGYHSLLTPQIQATYDKLLEVDNIRTKAQGEKFITYIRNLLTSSLNIYALEAGPKLNKIVEFLINEIQIHVPGTKHFDLQSLVKIAMILRRAEYKEELFWTAFFKAVSETTREIGAYNFELFYIFQTFEIFRDDKSYAKALKVIDNFKSTHSHIYKEILSFDITKSTEEKIEKFSMLNHQVDTFLSLSIYKFEREALINNLFYVDFLIPDSKVIFELQGPTHYLKPGNTKFNLLTVFKTKCMEKLGYKVISIPFNTVIQNDISFDRYILEKLEEKIPIKSEAL